MQMDRGVYVDEYKDGRLVKAGEQTSPMVRRAEQRSQVELTDR